LIFGFLEFLDSTSAKRFQILHEKQYPAVMFRTRSNKLERIDTGDYTEQEYGTFMREIRFINQRLGDRTALEKTLLADLAELDLKEFSVLDVGAGSGELLGVIAEFAREGNRKAKLVGLDLNELSAREVAAESKKFSEISSVRGDALNIPFPDDAFDYVICSLFTHHLTDEQVVSVLPEMSRVASRSIFVIDLERSPMAWVLFGLYSFAFRISRLVREDGLLSIRRSFRPEELKNLGEKAGLRDVRVLRVRPYRIVLAGK
jgi:ubiquinone/menaquinone biosynthesis C-methylase UbiE